MKLITQAVLITSTQTLSASTNKTSKCLFAHVDLNGDYIDNIGIKDENVSDY